MYYYLIVFAATTLLALQFVQNKAYQTRKGSGIRASLVFMTVKSLISTVLLFVFSWIFYGKIISVTPISLLFGMGVAALCFIYTIIGFKIFKFGSLSVFTTFLMLGGTVLPYFVGLIWLGEEVNAVKIVGMVLLTVSLIFPIIGQRTEKKSAGRMGVFVLLCFLVFILNGLVSTLSKFQASGDIIFIEYERVKTVYFPVITNAAALVFSGFALLVYTVAQKLKRNKGVDNVTEIPPLPIEPKEKAKGNVPAVVFIAVAAVFDGASYALQIFSAEHVEASILYPIQTGGSILLTALAGWLFFKEKPNKMAAIGLAVTFVSTFVFLL